MYEIKEITSEVAEQIIINMKDEKNYGLFYVSDEDGFTGIDNSTGDAWTEDFDNKEDLFAWLHGDIEISELEQ